MHLDDFWVMVKLIDLQGIEPMKGRDLPVLFKTMDLEVVPDTDMVPNPFFIEESNPMPAHKLSVGQQAVNTFAAKPLHKLLYQGYALLFVGVPPFVQHGEHQWESHIPITHSQHQYVDIAPAKLPVGSVHHQGKVVLFWQEAKDQPGNHFHRKTGLGHEPLDATQTT